MTHSPLRRGEEKKEKRKEKKKELNYARLIELFVGCSNCFAEVKGTNQPRRRVAVDGCNTLCILYVFVDSTEREACASFTDVGNNRVNSTIRMKPRTGS